MKYKYYTNGINEKRIPLDQDPPEGWYPGRLKSCVTTKGCFWINNGIEEQFLSKDKQIPDGWTKGRIIEKFNSKQQAQTLRDKHFHHYTDGVNDFFIAEGDPIPDNLVKGRPEMSKEWKEKISNSHKGLTHTEESKRKISQNSNNNRPKAYKTIIEKYGSFSEYYRLKLEKDYETKRKNKSFNTSKPEIELYNSLCEQYGKDNVLRNYKCERYPYYCDFYIPSEDKFIELNLHWTHGLKPYDKNDEFCQNQLKVWQEKAKTSQFYQEAINTWTIRDVRKLETAKNNNLNYEVIY